MTKLTSRDRRTDFMASECHVGRFPGGPVVMNLSANAGDMGSTPIQEDSTCCGATKPVLHNY